MSQSIPIIPSCTVEPLAMYDELHGTYKLAMSKVTDDDKIICWFCFMKSASTNVNEIEKDKLSSHNSTKHSRCQSTCRKCGCVFLSEGELGTHDRFMHT